MRFLFLLFMSFSFEVWSHHEINSRIHAIDFGDSSQDEVLLLLTSGQVLRATRGQGLESILKEDSFQKKWWKIQYNHQHEFLTATQISTPKHSGPQTFPEIPYEPTVVSENNSERYFHESRFSKGETQCFNRAHIWAYELWKNHDVKSQKIFLFFSRKYIREHKFEWWFHVAPLIRTKNWIGDNVERVMDFKYMTNPRSPDWWAGIFVKGNSKCQWITKYSEYADFPYSGDCFFFKTPMYIYQPLDLELLEVWGVEKNDWNLFDVTEAYREAFNIEFSGENL